MQIKQGLLVAIIILLSACATYPVPMDYNPTNVKARPQQKPIVEVGRFRDNRGADSNWIGAVRGGLGNPLKTLVTDKPVSEVVQKQFADGLKARRMLADPGTGQFILSGYFTELYCNQIVRKESKIDIKVDLNDAKTGASRLLAAL